MCTANVKFSIPVYKGAPYHSLPGAQFSELNISLIAIIIYLSGFFNNCRRLPETKRHSSVFLHWSGSKFLVVMAACTPSIHAFLGRPLFLLSRGILSIINFGILYSNILLTWPYHCSLFFSTMSVMSRKHWYVLKRLTDWLVQRLIDWLTDCLTSVDRSWNSKAGSNKSPSLDLVRPFFAVQHPLSPTFPLKLLLILGFSIPSCALEMCHMKYTGLFISPSGISELDCATTKTDTAERSISIGRESLCPGGLGVIPGSTATG